jgi:hypothetical protein
MRRFNETNQPGVRLIRQEVSPYAAATNDPLATLERRLDDGYARIEQALAQGEDVTAWEDFWIELLHQYESAVDCMPEAA